MQILQDKKILVTGGSLGIGVSLVRMAMPEGAQVAFIYRNSTEAAQQLVEEMTANYPEQRCFAIQADISHNEQMQETLKGLAADFGDIDVLINNAGVTRDAQLARMTREQWDEVISTNLGSMFNVTQSFVLPMVKRRTGSIINLTSIAGIYGSRGQVNYSASKAGIIGFTKALSKEVAPFNVRINAVAPGFIETEMTELVHPDRLKYVQSQISLGRLGTREDVAHLVCFLASDRASYITGQVLQVDGGITL